MKRRSSPIAPIKHGVLSEGIGKIESLIPERLRFGRFRLVSFKNRILWSTLPVLIGGVLIIAMTLRLAVFPQLEGDERVITNLKTIHLVASLAVILLSLVFIEFLSLRISLPLQRLTKRAEEISREAGKRIASTFLGEDDAETLFGDDDETDARSAGDEIAQLTTSFNRMLISLKASEDWLRESEEKYRFLFDNAPAPIFVVDALDLSILDLNARAKDEYHYTRDELLGKGFLELGRPEDQQDTKNLLRRLVTTEVKLPPVLQHRRKDGTTFMCNIQAHLTRFRGGQAIIAAVWDVTEKLEQEAMLVQTGKMATLGEMATGIAHELNQPLNVIKIAADYITKSLAKGRPPSETELQRIATEMSSNVDRASRIITHLRDFGRKSEEVMDAISINKPIRGVMTLLGTQLNKRGIQCELDLSEDLPKILGDSNKLEQVFINLVINARDAMLGREKDLKSKGQSAPMVMKLKSFLHKDRVVVTVSDTGPGVPASLRAKIFEPFFTTKKVGEGTGLGLSISYGIVKQHNGTIEVDGERRTAGGATFRLTFPSLGHGRGTGDDEDSGN